MLTVLRDVFVVGLAGIWLLGCAVTATEEVTQRSDGAAASRVVKTPAEELILIQEVTIAAPIEEVWKAYTTAEGWTGWASPRAKIDLRVGGTIHTSYDGEIGGPNTNTLHIVNYVPNRVLTLKTNVSDSWPEIMKEDADKLSNVILFEGMANGESRIQSFGIGYSDAPEYEGLMRFFIKANEALYGNLKTYLEKGVRVDWNN